MAGGSLGSLVVSLEANIVRFTSDMGRAAQQTEQTMNRMDRASAQTQRAMNSLQNTAGLAGAALVGMMAGLSVQKLIQYSDSWTNIESRIKLVTSSSAELASVQGQLFDIAQRNFASVSSTVALYTRLAQSSDTLGASQKDMIKFTEGVSAAVTLSGAGTQEAAGALQQLSQAMSNANIQAQEYNSINDGAPEILRAVARGIQGVDGDLGKLRARVLEGKLSSKEFFAAFMADADNLATRAQSMTMTVANAYVKLNNEAMKFVGEASKASGAGQMLAGTISSVANNLDMLAAGVGGLVTFKLSEWTLLITAALVQKANAAYTTAGALSTERFATIASAEANVANAATQVAQVRAKAGFIAELRAETLATLARTNAVIQSAASDAASTLAMQSRAVAMAELAALGRAQVAIQAQITAATVASTAAQASLTAANAAGAGAAGLATRAMGLLGGPIGVITTLLGVGAAAWLYWGNSSKDAESKSEKAVEESTENIIANLDSQIKKLQERNRLASSGLREIAQSGTAEAARMVQLREQMSAVSDGKGDYAGLNESARTEILVKLGAQYGTLYARIQTVNLEKDKLARADDGAATTKWLAEYATKAEKLAAKLKEIRASYKDGVIPPEVEARVRESFAEKAPKVKKTAENDEGKAITETTALIAKLREQIDTYGLADAAILKYQLNLTKTPSKLAAEAVALQENIDAMKASEALRESQQDAYQKMEDDARRAAEQSEANVEQIRVSLMSELEAEYSAHEAKLEELRRFGELKLENVEQANSLIELETQRHEAVLRDMDRQRADQKMAIDQQLLQQAGGVADQMYSMLKQAGLEQTALGKAAFLASKAIAVAQIILSTNVAAAAALAPPPIGLGPVAGLGYAGMIKGMGYASAAMVAGLSIAEASAEGGYDIPGGVNPVTQLHEKEMVLPRAQADVIRGLASRGGGAGANITYAPQINIDARTDQAEVHKLVVGAVQQGNADLVDKLQRAGRI